MFLLVFLAIGALVGGGILIIFPSVELLGTPLSMLETSPFHNFLILGIILFTFIGIASRNSLSIQKNKLFSKCSF